MIRLEQPVIVEGKYDKITLENIIDALIIPTNGFGIFKDREKCALIRQLAQKSGIIVMTDSDAAGGVIRAYLKKITDGAPIINVYVPQLMGKEKRKTKPSKEGLLGVEGMTEAVIRQALSNAGVFAEKPENRPEITKADLFRFGLSGGTDSAAKRKSFAAFIGLPQNLSPSALLDVLNTMLGYDGFLEKAAQWQENENKRE